MVSITSSLSTTIFSIRKYERGPPFACVIVTTSLASPTPGREGEPVIIFIRIPVLIPALPDGDPDLKKVCGNCSDCCSGNDCGCGGCSCLRLYAFIILLTEP